MQNQASLEQDRLNYTVTRLTALSACHGRGVEAACTWLVLALLFQDGIELQLHAKSPSKSTSVLY